MIWPAADISAFLSAMGQPVTLDDGSLAGSDIVGIYNNGFEPVTQFDGRIESSDPFVDCATADVGDVEHNQALRVNDQDYLVTGIQNDGTGWTRLYLRERFD